MTITITNSLGEKYEIKSRGKCNSCPLQVWTDQPREKNEQNLYWHIKCPRRIGGHLTTVIKFDKRMAKREEVFKKQGKHTLDESEELYLFL
jgi:hypothetical protein